MPSFLQLPSDSSRSIFFFDAVFSWSAKSVISDLIRMNEESKDEPIQLFINSVGGSVIDMYAIIDIMNLVKAPIHTYTLGIAASAGSLIAANGTKGKRFISTNSEMMLHEAAMQCCVDTRSGELDEIKTFMEKANDKFTKAYVSATGKSFEEMQKLLKSDSYITAKEAIKFGLADEIMTSEQISSIKLSEPFKKIKLSESFSLEATDSQDGLKTIHLLKKCSLKERGVEITSQTLACIVDNFKAGVRGQDISIEYNTHNNDDGENPAAAWIKELSLDDEGNNLYAKVEYSPKAQEMIKDKEYKYVSVEIDPIYENEEGKMFNNVLLGATFTNRPAVKGLNPLKLSENNNHNQKIKMDFNKEQTASINNVTAKLNMKIEDIYDSLVAMTEKNVSITAENKTLQASVTDLQAENKKAKDIAAKVVQDQIDSEKTLAVDALIAKGIIAQVNKDKNLEKFSSKAEIEDFYKDAPAVISVEAKGSGTNEDSTVEAYLEKLAKETGHSVDDIKKHGGLNL